MLEVGKEGISSIAESYSREDKDERDEDGSRKVGPGSLAGKEWT